VPYVNGYCPVDPGDELPYVIASSGQKPVLLYCPSCECAWPTRAAVEIYTKQYTLSDFGLREATIRYATEAEIQTAGQAVTGTTPDWYPLPRSC
jgi:hypothetical protein